MPQRSVFITDKQDEFIDKEGYNLSKLVRIMLDEKMKEKTTNASKKQ